MHEWPMRELYEELYCARGEMENRIKEAQLNLFADRLSTETFRANQLRLWLSSAAYVLMHALRRIGLSRHEPRSGLCEHDPPEATEDRRGGHGERATGEIGDESGLSEPA